MPHPIGPDLLRRLATVSDPTLAPDGRRAAYVLSWIDPATSENRSRIYQVAPNQNGAGNGNRNRNGDDENPSEPQPFTQGSADTHPRYSPDGRTLAFLRPAAPAAPQANASAASPNPQIWLMPAHGGEARPLSTLPNGVREFAWAPDSRRLAAVSDVCPDAAPVPGDDTPQVRAVNRIRYRHDAMGWRGDCHYHIFIVDAQTGAASPITAGDWDDHAPAWSPDGRRLAFISGRRPDRDAIAAGQAYVLPVPDAIPNPSPDDLPVPELRSADLADVAAIAWSPDGRQLLAVAAPETGLTALWQAYLYILPPGAPPQRITDDAIRPCVGYPGIAAPVSIRWTAARSDSDSDGNSSNAPGQIIFLADAAGQTRLYTLPVPADSDTDAAADADADANPAAPVPLTSGGEQIISLATDAHAARAVIIATTPEAPAELHHLTLKDAAKDAAARRRLTAHNAPWLAEHPPAPMEKFLVERDDFDIECRLYHPPNFDPARQYPLVLEIHGGPNGAFYDAFNPIHQTLAGAGYLTLAVNPRGSSTYGAEFVNAVLGDWGGDDYRDLMAALDAVCARPYVDANRLGIHGYSYGGYMTAWAIGHTRRFRAAVAGAPCIDLWTMYGTSDIATGFGEAQWAIRLGGGMPVSRPLLDELAGSVDTLAHRLLQRSPIKYAPEVATPVLLLHGEADARCPIGQSEQYFQVLKRLGKEVAMARFPDCAHTFLRTGHIAMRQAYLQRMLTWFHQWL